MSEHEPRPHPGAASARARSSLLQGSFGFVRVAAGSPKAAARRFQIVNIARPPVDGARAPVP